MAMIQCSRGHQYDDRRHLHCPYCPIPGLKDVSIPGTQAASMSRSPGVPTTEAASMPRTGDTTGGTGGSGGSGTTTTRATGSAGGRPPPNLSGVTVARVLRKTGIDPVVGWLVCIKGANKGRDYRLHSDRNKIGRASNMDVCFEGDETVSRENHCQITYSPRSNVFNIIPGDGRNLIYLNEQDVLGAERLNPYDQLDIGEGSYLFIPFSSDKFTWDAATLQRHRPPDEDQPNSQPGEGGTI